MLQMDIDNFRDLLHEFFKRFIRLKSKAWQTKNKILFTLIFMANSSIKVHLNDFPLNHLFQDLKKEIDIESFVMLCRIMDALQGEQIRLGYQPPEMRSWLNSLAYSFARDVYVIAPIFNYEPDFSLSAGEPEQE